MKHFGSFGYCMEANKKIRPIQCLSKSPRSFEKSVTLFEVSGRLPELAGLDDCQVGKVPRPASITHLRISLKVKPVVTCEENHAVVFRKEKTSSTKMVRGGGCLTKKYIPLLGRHCEPPNLTGTKFPKP